METLEALAKRIGTTKNLHTVVRTMKALSAASIAQYDRAVIAMSRYMQTVELGLTAVLRSGEALPRRPASEPGAEMAIVYGSDRSLCGTFNEIIVRAATAEMEKRPGRRSCHWLAIGARALQGLEAAGHKAGDWMPLPGTSGGLVETSHRILLTIDDWRARYGVTRVLVFHNRRRDVAASPHHVQLLPLDRRWLEQLARRSWTGRTIPMFTMEAEAMFAALVREHLFANVFRSGAESLASEHATRLAQMQAALRNIDEHIDEMSGDYRRKRQDSITSELLDIVAGYEAFRT